jgi:hypothetical protein
VIARRLVNNRAAAGELNVRPAGGSVTEAQWLAHTFPPGMVPFLKGIVSDRKLRLFACACARWTWDQPPDERCQVAVEAAERFADGEATAEELAASYGPARRVSIEWARQHPGDPRQHRLIAPADAAARCPLEAAHIGSLDAGWSCVGGGCQPDSAEYAALADLARCIFGNPFRPIPLVAGWCSPAVVSLARTIYAERAFGRMLLLADALAGAGCDDPDVLRHCRGSVAHARGCWIIDLLLGNG